MQERDHGGKQDAVTEAWAHSAVGGLRHSLAEHLEGTAGRAAEFAAAFDAEEVGRLLGLWHDLGKFHPDWQRYLLDNEAGRRARGGPGHKAAGTLLAMQHLGVAAFAIAGHHGGLPPRHAGPESGRIRSLEQLCHDEAERANEALTRARAQIADLEPARSPGLPPYVRTELDADLFVRMVFSALVDADFLDTEQHFDPLQRGAARKGAPVAIKELFARLEAEQRALIAGARPTEVNRARAEIYEACLAAAEQRPGFFRLTVPTGGGKTRSGLAFALRHAALHGQRRVVVAVPFISITEQTAAEYRRIFGEVDESGRVVLEHHSGGDIAEEDGEQDEAGAGHLWARLAAENWDAPLIVTTTVQLFESLFARKPSKMRKLHRLAGSVIVLDEAQALPPTLLEPALDVLRGLVEHYGVTVVLSTATQPAFESIPAFRDVGPREIVPEPERYFRTLERVEYEWRLDPRLSWAEVAEEMRGQRRALAIVNTKADALALLDALEAAGVAEDELLHLSTLLCGAHRRRVIAEVKRRQDADERCLLVATQVVEAGVDIDFPVVYRAFAPLDAIVQAAGRCNREGREARGRVVVFEPEAGGIPGGTYRTARDTARSALQIESGSRPDGLELLRRYFELLYQAVQSDDAQVQAARKAFDFPATAQRFRLIDDDTVPVVVTRYGDDAERQHVRDLLDELRKGGPNGRELRRRLQPYTVALRQREWERRNSEGLVSEVVAGLGEWHGGYDDELRGLGTEPGREPLVV